MTLTTLQRQVLREMGIPAWQQRGQAAAQAMSTKQLVIQAPYLILLTTPLSAMAQRLLVNILTAVNIGDANTQVEVEQTFSELSDPQSQLHHVLYFSAQVPASLLTDTGKLIHLPDLEHVIHQPAQKAEIWSLLQPLCQ
ncbi:DNA polymerase III psi subunit [Methylophaga frappieri]|uniref:DNA polymerase III psi subunit n=1 Tax=Methylophaga frappieri (strain ATCC BAA-2434 / DSM 25690 / JAM7) TaxID=754477 RepID=I1YLI5_METFJ|nr:DNA polymerase III subunit psi [Methylophaga frappieri]AFJ03778.1 DNA polymerase III psi subunit [Methylophaga frappieri]